MRLHLASDPVDCRLDAKPTLNTDQHQVERIGEVVGNLLLALLRCVVDEDGRQEKAEDRRHDGNQPPLRSVQIEPGGIDEADRRHNERRGQPGYHIDQRRSRTAITRRGQFLTHTGQPGETLELEQLGQALGRIEPDQIGARLHILALNGSE